MPQTRVREGLLVEGATTAAPLAAMTLLLLRASVNMLDKGNLPA